MRLFFIACTSILIAFPFLMSWAQNKEEEIPAFTLEEAQDYALEHSTDMKNARLDREIAAKDVVETRAQGLPQIDAQISSQKNFDIRTNVIAFQFPGASEAEQSEVKFGTDYNMDPQFSASQLIFDGSFFMGLKAAKTYVDLSSKQQKQTAAETQAQIAKAYYSALVSKRNLEIIEKNVEQVSKNLEETRAMYENGFVEELDVDRLSLTLENLKNRINNAKKDYQIARKLLKFQMGYPISDSIVLSDELDQTLPDSKERMAVPEDFSPEQRPEFQILQAQEELNILNKKRYQAQYLPRVSAFATHAQFGQSDDFNSFFETGDVYFPSTYAGIRVTLPIFQGFARSARVQKAEINLQKTRNQKAQLQENIQLEIERAQKEYSSAYDRAKNQKQNLELAEKIYNQAQTKYEEGAGSSLEIHSARNDLFDAQAQYINAIYEFLIAETDLKKALAEYN